MTACLVCPAFWPPPPHDRDLVARECRWPNACEPCRRRLSSCLLELPDLYALLPQVLAPGSSGESTKVSGSREPPVPPDLDVVDLTMPSRQGSVGVRMSGGWAASGGDPLQVGHLSVLTVLDFWVRDWRDARSCGEGLPVPTVASLSGWLGGLRLRWACDMHPAVDEFARDVSRLLYACRRALSLAKHIIRLPVPCPSPECDCMALYRESGAEYVECGACGRLWTEQEYRRLAVLTAADLEAYEERKSA